MEEGEHLFAFLNDLYIESGRFTPSSNGSCFATPTLASTFKTKIWNRSGDEPEACARLQAAAVVVDESAVVWRGDHTLPVSSQEVKILGSPVGHPGYVSAQACEVRFPFSPPRWRISAAVVLVRKPRPISFCGPFTPIRLSSTQRDTTIVVGSVCVGSCGCPLTWVSLHSRSHHCPSQWGDWSSWADCVHMLNKRHPQICRPILRSIVTDDPPHHIEGVTIGEAALCLSGFHPPSWEELTESLRPGRCVIKDEDLTEPRFGWQTLTAESVELDFRESVLVRPLPVDKRAVLRSQSGPFSSTPYVAFPTTKATTFDPSSSACGCSDESTSTSQLLVWPSSRLPWPPPCSLRSGRGSWEKGVPSRVQPRVCVPGGRRP